MKGISCFFVLLVLSAVLTSAAAEQELADLFDTSEDIAPPSLGIEGEVEVVAPQMEGATEPTETPASDWASGAKAMEVAPMLAAPASTELHTLVLEVKDIETGQPITDVHVRLNLENRDNGDVINTIRFISSDGILTETLRAGNWDMSIDLDDPTTSGKDYYSTFEISLFENATLTAFVQPVASAFVTVYDNTGSRVAGATVQFDCSASYGDTSSGLTDSYGSLNRDWLPTGFCRISARSNSQVGSITAVLLRGQLAELLVNLDEGVSESSGDHSWVLIASAGILLVIGFFIYRRKHAYTPVITKKEPIRPNARITDMVSTLDQTEKKIISLIMERGGEALQSKIRDELNMPKSSLSRYVSGLESRGVIETEKLGRIKRIRLTDWFLTGKKQLP